MLNLQKSYFPNLTHIFSFRVEQPKILHGRNDILVSYYNEILCLFFCLFFSFEKNFILDSYTVYFLGRSVMSVLTFIPSSWFSQWSETTTKKRGDEYEAFKHKIGQNIIDQVVHLFPKLKVIMTYTSNFLTEAFNIQK